MRMAMKVTEAMIWAPWGLAASEQTGERHRNHPRFPGPAHEQQFVAIPFCPSIAKCAAKDRYRPGNQHKNSNDEDPADQEEQMLGQFDCR